MWSVLLLVVQAFRMSSRVVCHSAEKSPSTFGLAWKRSIVDMDGNDGFGWMERILHGRRGVRPASRSIAPPLQNAPAPVSRYKPPEEWSGNNRTCGESSWERLVQFDAQRDGNRFRQDQFLRDQLRKG